MDAAAFEQVYGAFGDFHAYFAPLFGRRETRDHSRHYLQALLVQSGERRNAENLSETVPASARVMQRFLAESPGTMTQSSAAFKSTWDPGLDTLRGCGCWTAATSPSRAESRSGVASQYCGRLGRVANCQAGMFLAYVSPVGPCLGGQSVCTCRRAGPRTMPAVPQQGVPEERRGYRPKMELALGDAAARPWSGAI